MDAVVVPPLSASRLVCREKRLAFSRLEGPVFPLVAVSRFLSHSGVSQISWTAACETVCR